MFVYLSKRIAIPNGVQITSIAWSEEQGWLACGGEGGLLKVLKVDGGSQGQKSGGLSANQTLEGHDSTVTQVAWNQHYCKLTSSDANGRIIVWMLHKGMWFEEMVNNRNKSRVVDLTWSATGTKICIAYEDGAVIVGGVEGNRLWGREFAYELAKVCWSADDRYILFGTSAGSIFVHDAAGGQLVCQLGIQCEEEGKGKLAAISWHSAWVERPEPIATLAVCYASGKMQLMQSISDENTYFIDTAIPIQFIAWNPQGTILAVSAIALTATQDSSVVVTQFYNNDGMHLRTLRVAGKKCGGITWEGDGLRVAIAVDSSVYFANVRPDYKYCYFNKTIVFSFQVPDKVEESVTFWNVNSNERSTKHIRGLQYISACKDACVVISRPGVTQKPQCMLQLLNAIGSPIETRLVDFEPYSYGINSSHVVCCGDEHIYLWQFRDPAAVVDALDPISMQASRSESGERIIHVDDIVRPDTEPTMKTRSALTNDLICTVCLSEEYMFIGRESGMVHVYLLDPLQLVGKYILPSRAQSMDINCDSSQLAVVDLGGVMRLYPIEREKFSIVPRKAESVEGVERKDVWDLRWALDDPHRLAVMEKTRMYLYDHGVAEEPVQSCCNLCKFKSLKVRALQFDELMLDPERPRKECVIDFETQLLRDMRSTMLESPMKVAYEFAEKNAHPKLWDLLAEHALLRLDFTYAEMAFIRSKDYPAIQFLKRIRGLDDPKKQLAEVNAYLHRFDEGERLYKEIDRKDLALDLRYRLGDWFGVVRLVQEGGGDETLLVKAWENIGDHYADRQKWSKAVQYYTQCRNYRKLARIFYLIEDYEMLTQLISMAEHDKELLCMLGRQLLTVGLAEEAAKAFVAAGEPRQAVDGCVQVNMWNKAISLAEEHHLDDVGQLLTKYAKYLLQRERLPEAIELYRKAGKHDEAAKLLAQLGQNAAVTDPLKAKKFYVLSALEVVKYRTTAIALNREGAEVVSDLLNKDHNAVSERTLDAAWRGAEAYHFYLICQQQILDKNFGIALTLAMRLMEYDDLVSPVDAYSLIALAAYLAKNYGVCSRAFARLENAELNDEAGGGGGGAADNLANFSMDLDVTQRTMASTSMAGTTTGGGGTAGGSALSGTTTSLQLTNPGKGVTRAAALTYPTVGLVDPPRRFADLAVKIFTKYPPTDTSVDKVPCATCGSFNKEWASQCIKCHQPFGTCIVSGRAIVSDEDVWQCPVCRRKAVESMVGKYRSCPLCHTPKKSRSLRGI